MTYLHRSTPLMASFWTWKCLCTAVICSNKESYAPNACLPLNLLCNWPQWYSLNLSSSKSEWDNELEYLYQWLMTCQRTEEVGGAAPCRLQGQFCPLKGQMASPGVTDHFYWVSRLFENCPKDGFWGDKPWFFALGMAPSKHSVECEELQSPRERVRNIDTWLQQQ